MRAAIAAVLLVSTVASVSDAETMIRPPDETETIALVAHVDVLPIIRRK